jgi:16S rRNA (guanine1207-N2)-methyltransferase
MRQHPEYKATEDVDPAATILIEVLDEIETGPRPLIVNEESGALGATLRERGTAPAIWNRRFLAGNAGQPWPSGDTQATSAFVRLDKSKEAFRLALGAAASVLPAGAPLVVFGANAEGVRSISPLLKDVVAEVETLATKRHCRVMRGARSEGGADRQPALSHWRRERTITLRRDARPWVYYPGVFADGALDAGTRFLLDHLPSIPKGARVLDFGAGTGPIAAAVLETSTDAAIDLIEIDSLALEAARENVPNAARLIASDSLAAAIGPYDAILSNPPIHNGIAENHAVLEALITGARGHLRRGGVFCIVLQRRVKAAERIKAAFGNCSIVADDGRFTVLSATAR